jgi:hypothetical protein
MIATWPCQYDDTADLFPCFAWQGGTKGIGFLQSWGYYKVELAANGEPDTKTLQELENVPGAAARFAANQFAQWQLAKQQSRESTTP